MAPYECPLCVFRKLRKVSPDPRQYTDKILLDCITRAILDAFWSRSSLAVLGYAQETSKLLSFVEIVGIDALFEHSGLLPWRDHCGYGVAIAMLLYSKQKGKNDEDHMLFDTIRNIQTVYSNFVRASPQALAESWSLGDPAGQYQRFNNMNVDLYDSPDSWKV